MERLLGWDRQLLLILNGSGSGWLDNVMWALSDTWTWTLLLVVLLYKVARAYSPYQFILFCSTLGLAILMADLISSGVVKPLVHRPRPTYEPAIMEAVDVVRGYRGGMYGFVSSHAANTFAAATFVSLVMRRRLLAVALFLWAALVSYSRIYLGVHYPGDILCGALLGVPVGYVCYLAFVYALSADLRRARFTFRPVCHEAAVSGTWALVVAILLTLLLVFLYALIAA